MSRLDLNELKTQPLDALLRTARSLNVLNAAALPRQQLLNEVLRAQTYARGQVGGSGVLEILPDGFGFLRNPEANYQPDIDDIYVSPSQIRRFNLRNGDEVGGLIRPPKETEKYFALIKVEAVGGEDPDRRRRQVPFDELRPVWPDRRFTLATRPDAVTARLIDLLTPVGRGARGLITTPPRADRLGLLAAIAEGLAANHPEAHTMLLLVDQRPEDVTEIRESIAAEVAATTFDEPPARHVQIAEMAIERARRLVEGGRDVVLLVDSLTRLIRAWNQTGAGSNGQLPGGLDVSALHRPKRLFGSARNIEGGGSLTVLAVALTDTGARIDETILDELQGAANLELTLSPALVARRLSPPLDPARCFTERAERLLDADGLARRRAMRDAWGDDPLQSASALLDAARRTGDEASLLAAVSGEP